MQIQIVSEMNEENGKPKRNLRKVGKHEKRLGNGQNLLV
jgi:hypothetical protein